MKRSKITTSKELKKLIKKYIITRNNLGNDDPDYRCWLNEQIEKLSSEYELLSTLEYENKK
jgi:hypothetical protein